MPQQDNLLIAEFNARRSEEAFAALVRQHVNLVFATALRQVGDAGAAEEIAQNVFVALAQAAGKLKSHPTIAGWLHQTALNKSREWLRSELRRRRREQVAVNLDLARAEGDSVWLPLVPLLDEALLKLREPDRVAVILHYMEGRSFHEVGSALGVGEDAARKRVHRCLDQLTDFFRRRGFAVPSLAAGAPLFAFSSHAAPAGLAASATAAGLAAAHSATSTLTLIKGALKIMAWTKAKTVIVAGTGVLLAGAVTTSVVVQQHRAAESRQLITFHIRGQMRTYPNDNFSAISPDADFVTVELWKQSKPNMEWRVEKPGRVAVMDGRMTMAYFKPDNLAMKFPKASPSAFDTDWIQQLAMLKDNLTNVLKAAHAKGWKVDTTTTWEGEKRKSVVTLEAKSGLPDSSEQKNHFLTTADRREVYRFDDETKQLEAVQIYLEEKSGETLVFESSEIDYNQSFKPALFHLDLPANVSWYQEPQKVAGYDKYATLTADQAAQAFFDACSREDWDEVAKFWDMPINDQFKQYLGGLKIIHLGAAYASKPYPGRFVPYEIQLPPQEFNVRVSNTNAAGRYVITGTYDGKLQPQEELKWPDSPASLPDGDTDAKLSPAEVVKAYFQAMANSDWVEMRKFTPESDVEKTQRQMEEANKEGVPLPNFEAGEAFWSAEHSAYFVKCQMRWTKKFKMAIRNDNPAKHWIVDGGL